MCHQIAIKINEPLYGEKINFTTSAMEYFFLSFFFFYEIHFFNKIISYRLYLSGIFSML